MSNILPAAAVPRGRELVPHLVGTTTCMFLTPTVGTKPSTVQAFSFQVAASTIDGILPSESITNIWVALGYGVNNHFFVKNAQED